MRKAPIVHGICRPIPFISLILGFVQGDRDGSGAEEEGDLAEGVHGDVQAAAEDAPTIGQGCAEDDVGEAG